MPRYKKEEEKYIRPKVGRPTTPVEEGQWKSVRLPSHIWEGLDNLADQAQEPIYKVVSRVVEENLPILKPITSIVPLSDALAVLGRQIYYGKRQISPYMVVTAIRKGRVYGKRARVHATCGGVIRKTEKSMLCLQCRQDVMQRETRYKWFVDLDQLYHYLSKHPTVKRESRKLLSEYTKKPKPEPPLPNI